MIAEILEDAGERMGKSIESLQRTFLKIRSGRAHPALLEGIDVDYYGVGTPLSQIASISVEDGRTLVVSPWEKPLGVEIEKAILKSDIGITPVNSGEVIRVPLPPLTEENRKDLVKKAKSETENSRVAVRNIRRDAIADIREMAKEKLVAEDDARKGEESVQSITDENMKSLDGEPYCRAQTNKPSSACNFSRNASKPGTRCMRLISWENFDVPSSSLKMNPKW